MKTSHLTKGNIVKKVKAKSKNKTGVLFKIDVSILKELDNELSTLGITRTDFFVADIELFLEECRKNRGWSKNDSQQASCLQAEDMTAKIRFPI